MKAYSQYLGLGLGILAAIPCAILAVAAAGAGHGTYLAARLLFPFTMFSTLVGSPITAPFVVVGLLQFPVYGFVSGLCYKASRLRQGLLTVTAAHIVAVILTLIIPSPNFPNRVWRSNPPPPANPAVALVADSWPQGRGVAEADR